jgi:VWA domain-containing protein
MQVPPRLPVVIATILIALAAAAHTVAQSVQRSLYVSVVDKDGKPVPDLGPADFLVQEDRVTREVLTVAPANDPMQIALLVDNSQASDPFIRDYREALPAFINEMMDAGGPRNEMALIALADRPTIFTQYTTDRTAMLKGVQRIFAMPGAATYLLDGLIETSRGITKRNTARPVIVAVTSEGPELSDRFYQQVLEPLKESGAACNILVIGRPINQEHDRAVVLDRATKDSGGRWDTILISTALTDKMKEIALDLKSQYKVTYARPQTLIPPENITVSVKRPDLTARGTPVRAEREAKK